MAVVIVRITKTDGNVHTFTVTELQKRLLSPKGGRWTTEQWDRFYRDLHDLDIVDNGDAVFHFTYLNETGDEPKDGY
jgi:hypothetical protein